eukprot:scaffold8477_cov23-Cyclotella_meneghiniana.AAC.4
MVQQYCKVDCDILQQYMEGLSCDESFDWSDDDGDRFESQGSSDDDDEKLEKQKAESDDDSSMEMRAGCRYWIMRRCWMHRGSGSLMF